MRRELRLFDEIDRFAAGGEVAYALALSFGLDGDVAAERIFTPLIERYGVRHPVVIASGAVDAGTKLGVPVLRAGRMGRVFHPKLLLAVREGAVFLSIGSANLTRGGLGANLEIVTPLLFGDEVERPAPAGVLASALAFTESVIAGLRVADHSRGKAREVLSAASEVLRELRPAKRGPDLRFVHSLEQPLWDQLAAQHGDDPVTELVVVSPFFESDDPDRDEWDSMLRHALGEGLPWAARGRSGSAGTVRPRGTLHVGALGARTVLPRAALEELGSAVELRPQALSVEPRRLHAKVIAVVGKRRTTMLWGSPNFTPSALLRSAAGGGNVECGLLLHAPAPALDGATVRSELDLDTVFHLHHGALPEPVAVLPPEPVLFEVGEVLYDPEKRVLALHGEVYDAAVQAIRARLDGVPGASLLIEGKVVAGPISLDVAEPDIEEEDSETGRRRLRSLNVFVEALDGDGAVLASVRVRLNVRFEDALEVHTNLLLGKAALSADALLVPSHAPPEQRVAAIDAQIALWKAARRGHRAESLRHQASLDVFFRNVRYGLDARLRGLAERKGSRFALLRWSTDLQRALRAAADEQMDPTRRLYLVERVAAHVERVLLSLDGWKVQPSALGSVLQADRLVEALETVPLGDQGGRAGKIEQAVSVRRRACALLRALGGKEG